MTIRTRVAVAGAALATASMVFAPLASAEPVETPNPAPIPAPTADIEDPLVPIAAPEGSVIDTAVLPLNAEARWQSIPEWTWASPWLTGIELCSPGGVPPEVSDEVPWAPTSDVQHAVLVPGDGGNPQGWTGVVSFAPYASQQDAIGALHSYKVYIEHCPLVNKDAKVQNNGGIARNDPTAAHGVYVTHGHYVQTFAVALPNGVVELTFHRPADQAQVSFPYSPRDVIAALKGSNPRPVPVPRGPFGW